MNKIKFLSYKASDMKSMKHCTIKILGFCMPEYEFIN